MNTQNQTHNPMGVAAPAQGHAVNSMASQVTIGSNKFTLPRVPMSVARSLQVKMAKIAGGPFLALSSLTEEQVSDSSSEDAFSNVITNVLSSIQTKEVSNIIRELCELTINTSQGSPTVYDRDFHYKSADDIKLAIWVSEELFSDFFTELVKENLAGQVMGIVSGEKDSPQKLNE